jgi:hypothetical protein
MLWKWYAQVLRAGLVVQQLKQNCSRCPQWLSTFSTLQLGHLAMTAERGRLPAEKLNSSSGLCRRIAR